MAQSLLKRKISSPHIPWPSQRWTGVATQWYTLMVSERHHWVPPPSMQMNRKPPDKRWSYNNPDPQTRTNHLLKHPILNLLKNNKKTLQTHGSQWEVQFRIKFRCICVHLPTTEPRDSNSVGVGCGPRTHVLKMFLWKFQGITLVKAHNFNIFQRCVSRMQTQTSSFFLPSLLPSI